MINEIYISKKARQYKKISRLFIVINAWLFSGLTKLLHGLLLYGNISYEKAEEIVDKLNDGHYEQLIKPEQLIFTNNTMSDAILDYIEIYNYLLNFAGESECVKSETVQTFIQTPDLEKKMSSFPRNKVLNYMETLNYLRLYLEQKITKKQLEVAFSGYFSEDGTTDLMAFRKPLVEIEKLIESIEKI